MEIISNRKFVLATALAFFFAIAYMVYLEYFPDPRLDDGSITPQEMHWWELIHWIFLVVSMPLISMLALVHCFRHRRFGWLAGIFLFWPLVLIYTWKLSGESPINKSRLQGRFAPGRPIGRPSLKR